VGDIIDLKGEIDRRVADATLRDLLSLARQCGDNASAVKLRFERAMALIQSLAALQLTVKPSFTLPSDLRPDQLDKIKLALEQAIRHGALAAREEAVRRICEALPELCTSILTKR
jgi:hypothetical protein